MLVSKRGAFAGRRELSRVGKAVSGRDEGDGGDGKARSDEELSIAYACWAKDRLRRPGREEEEDRSGGFRVGSNGISMRALSRRMEDKRMNVVQQVRRSVTRWGVTELWCVLRRE